MTVVPELSPSQKEAFSVLSGTKENVFLTGGAGSGKSFLISQFLRDKDTRFEFPVLASTGAAAVLVGGRTFHSFFGLGLMQGHPSEIIDKSAKNRHVRYRLRKAKTLVIDEISMIPGPVLDIAEKICKQILDDSTPWGGLRIVSVGDFAQLPPVARGQKIPPWAFLSSSWDRGKFMPILLEENLRSDDENLSFVLHHIRNGQMDDQIKEILDSRYGPPYSFSGTQLFSKRMEAAQFNDMELSKIAGEVYTIPTRYAGQEQYIEALRRNAPISEHLALKIGAKVMIRINDPLLRYVNGSTGTVLDVKEDEVTVAIRNRPFTFEKMAFSYLDGQGEPKATATNFPLQLAWATTIHKSQGMTMDEMAVSLEGLWEPGQAYVAMSRVRSLDQLWIRRWSEKSIFCDSLVKTFYEEGCPFDFRETLGIEDHVDDFY
ncbi:MAG: DEAD/DEAH box helicase [Bdellovibrionota bacterium]